MLKEIEVELYEAGNIKKEGLSPAQEIMGDLSKYAVFNRNLSIERNDWVGDVLSNNSRIGILETKIRDNLYDIKILFGYVKDTPKEELEPIREVFRRVGLEKK